MPEYRPMSAWRLLGAALRLYRANFLTYVALSLIDSLVAWGLSTHGTSSWFLLLVIVLVIAGVAAQTLLFATAIRSATGAGGIPWPDLRRMWAFLLALLVITVAGTIGFALLILPGVLLLTWWAVTPTVVVAEGRGAFSALGRSRALVRGHFWHVLGTMALGALVFAAAFVVVTLVLVAHPPLSSLWQVVLGAIADPWVPCLVTVLYLDLRVRAGEPVVGPGVR